MIKLVKRLIGEFIEEQHTRLEEYFLKKDLKVYLRKKYGTEPPYPPGALIALMHKQEFLPCKVSLYCNAKVAFETEREEIPRLKRRAKIIQDILEGNK